MTKFEQIATLKFWATHLRVFQWKMLCIQPRLGISNYEIHKSLASSTWGKNEHILDYLQGNLNYTMPIWWSECSRSQLKKLQTCQKTASEQLQDDSWYLQKITYITRTACRTALSVKKHTFLSMQFLLWCFCRYHLQKKEKKENRKSLQTCQT